MDLIIKRMFDIVISMVLLGFLIVPILIIFFMLKNSSNESGIYYSDRVGKNNHIFKITKLRTMTSGAPEVPHT